MFCTFDFSYWVKQNLFRGSFSTRCICRIWCRSNLVIWSLWHIFHLCKLERKEKAYAPKKFRVTNESVPWYSFFRKLFTKGLLLSTRKKLELRLFPIYIRRKIGHIVQTFSTKRARQQPCLRAS